MPKRPNDKEKFDKLAEMLKDVKPERLQTLIMKSESLTIRLTPSDKAGMEQAAKACGLTVTDYLTRLHHVIWAKLERAK